MPPDNEAPRRQRVTPIDHAIRICDGMRPLGAEFSGSSILYNAFLDGQESYRRSDGKGSTGC